MASQRCSNRTRPPGTARSASHPATVPNANNEAGRTLSLCEPVQQSNAYANTTNVVPLTNDPQVLVRAILADGSEEYAEVRRQMRELEAYFVIYPQRHDLH